MNKLLRVCQEEETERDGVVWILVLARGGGGGGGGGANQKKKVKRLSKKEQKNDFNTIGSRSLITLKINE